MKLRNDLLPAACAILAGTLVVGAYWAVASAATPQDDFIQAKPGVIQEPFPRSQVITTTIPPYRVAVDLEIVGRKFYVLWNNGSVTTEMPQQPDLPPLPPCPGDIDGDGIVGVPDMLLLQAAWGKECPE